MDLAGEADGSGATGSGPDVVEPTGVVAACGAVDDVPHGPGMAGGEVVDCRFGMGHRPRHQGVGDDAPRRRGHQIDPPIGWVMMVRQLPHC